MIDKIKRITCFNKVNRFTLQYKIKQNTIII